MTFAMIGDKPSYSTSAYLIPISAKLHGFGEVTSDEFYKFGYCITNKEVTENGDNQDKVLLACNLVTLLFDRGYYRKTPDIVSELGQILANYYGRDKPFAKYLEEEDLSKCTEEERYVVSNILRMFKKQPLII